MTTMMVSTAQRWKKRSLDVQVIDKEHTVVTEFTRTDNISGFDEYDERRHPPVQIRPRCGCRQSVLDLFQQLAGPAGPPPLPPPIPDDEILRELNADLLTSAEIVEPPPLVIDPTPQVLPPLAPRVPGSEQYWIDSQDRVHAIGYTGNPIGSLAPLWGHRQPGLDWIAKCRILGHRQNCQRTLTNRHWDVPDSHQQLGPDSHQQPSSTLPLTL